MNAIQKEQIRIQRQQGIGYSKIAQSLSLSENTVKSYCKRNNLSGVAAVSVITCISEQSLCKNCGNLLSQKQGSKPRKFCSIECRNAWWNSHQDSVKKKAIYSIKCACCEKTFDSYGNKTRKFCCHSCYVAWRFKKAGGRL